MTVPSSIMVVLVTIQKTKVPFNIRLTFTSHCEVTGTGHGPKF